ncbi:hypothetical protein DFH07DRAFT_414498 [Mycena maculata]|uniref:Uncharacterized protein n=1 Tax=Mycena maculata TaxID=230809 RepID=A0AAD7JCF1_9AGAR|nr:hypothetical protein DFH07DRAFT_414498 [Mycena maculata]
MRRRNVTKLSTPDPISSSSSRRPTAPWSDVIDIPSSDDELDSYRKPKATANGKSRSKPHGSTTNSSSSNLAMPSPNQPSRKRPIPVTPSILPPSDPFPQSTGTTGYQPELEDDAGSVPPIATLGDTSCEPDSSPSSLKAKERPRPKPRPKKPLPPLLDHYEPLKLVEAEGFGGDRDTLMMPPPDLPNTSLGPALSLNSVPSSSIGPAPDALPDPAVATGAPPDKPPKKSRKKQGGEEGEKPAKKPRAKKAKKDAEGDQGAQDKPKKGKGKEKEEFKSAEFILDDDDEPMLPVEGAPPPPLAPLSNTSMDIVLPGSKPVSVISIPDSQPDEELVPLVGEKRKRVDEEDGDGKKKGKAEKKSKKAKTAGAVSDKEKTKKKAPAKKAKGRVVMSDDEEDGPALVPANDAIVDLECAFPPNDGMDVDLDLGGPIPDRTVSPVQPISDAEEEAPPKKTKAKKKQAKKTTVSDSEAEGDESFQNKPDVSTS